MALTSSEQNKIVQLLGFAGKSLQAGSVVYDKIMQDRLQSLPADTETLVRGYLAQVTAIETQLNAAICRLTAKKVGDIETNPQEMSMLRSERKKIAREVAQHLALPYSGADANVSIIV